MTIFSRTKDNPLPLKTPPGTSEFTMHADSKDGAQMLVCTVGKTVLPLLEALGLREMEHNPKSNRMRAK